MKKGFTLVELSIVLVIIGLLVGGVLVGQSLIDSAKLQKAVRAIQQYQAAVLLFKDKFKSLPGDSALFANPGNNDGQILGSAAENNYDLEIGNFWAHMSQSGMLKEQYTGTGASAGVFTLPANTMPKLDYGKKTQIVSGYVAYEGFAEPLNYENVFWLIDPPSQSRFVEGGAGNCGSGFTANDECDYPLSPVQAVAFDQKLDDGKPNTGSVQASAKADFGLARSLTWTTDACITNYTATGSYVGTETRNTCALSIRMIEK